MAQRDLSQIDVLVHNNITTYLNSLCMIDATHFILSYLDQDNNNWYVKTFSIDGSFDNITELDSVMFNSVVQYHTSVIKVDATHYAVSYSDASNDWRICMFSIDWSYQITEGSELEFDTSQWLYVSSILLDSTHIVIAHQWVNGDGFLRVIAINWSYVMTAVSVLEHDTADCSYNSLVKIDDTHFALAYDSTTNHWQLKTFSVDWNYAITEIDAIEFYSSAIYYNSLVLIDSTHLAVAYGNNTLWEIKTFSIDGSFDNITNIDTLQFTTDWAYNSMVLVDSTHLAVAYFWSEISTSGNLRIISFDGNYDNLTNISYLQYNVWNWSYNSMVLVDSTHLAVASQGAGWYWTLSTFAIEWWITANTTNFFQFM